MSNIVSGYVGLFMDKASDMKNPIKNHSVYAITGEDKKELNLIILTQGAYKTAYNLAKGVTYPCINIFVPCMNHLFISDIYRLVLDLQESRMNVKLYFPVVPKDDTLPEWFTSMIDNSTFISTEYLGLVIRYVKANEKSDIGYYDIIVEDGKTSKYFLTYLDENKAELIYIDNTLNDIQMGYNTTIFGGMSYTDLVEKYPNLSSKITVHSFSNETEYELCRDSNKINVGGVVWL